MTIAANQLKMILLKLYLVFTSQTFKVIETRSSSSLLVHFISIKALFKLHICYGKKNSNSRSRQVGITSRLIHFIILEEIFFLLFHLFPFKSHFSRQYFIIFLYTCFNVFFLSFLLLLRHIWSNLFAFPGNIHTIHAAAAQQKRSSCTIFNIIYMKFGIFFHHV
jgi:hypothetical protein